MSTGRFYYMPDRNGRYICFLCRSNSCYDSNHPREQFGVKMRIPKTHNKKAWKKLEKLLNSNDRPYFCASTDMVPYPREYKQWYWNDQYNPPNRWKGHHGRLEDEEDK